MTDRHKPSTAVVLSRYLAEASVYVLVTSVGADCYVCILSHSAIALRCAPPPVPRPTTHQPNPITPPFLSPAPFTSGSPPNSLAPLRLSALLLTHNPPLRTPFQSELLFLLSHINVKNILEKHLHLY